MIAREKHIAEVACRSYHEESHEYFAFCQGANWADANPVMPDEENDTGNEYAYVVHMKAKCAWQAEMLERAKVSLEWAPIRDCSPCPNNSPTPIEECQDCAWMKACNEWLADLERGPEGEKL